MIPVNHSRSAKWLEYRRQKENTPALLVRFVALGWSPSQQSEFLQVF
jgi:hypothetical protein